MGSTDGGEGPTEEASKGQFLGSGQISAEHGWWATLGSECGTGLGGSKKRLTLETPLLTPSSGGHGDLSVAGVSPLPQHLPGLPLSCQVLGAACGQPGSGQVKQQGR